MLVINEITVNAQRGLFTTIVVSNTVQRGSVCSATCEDPLDDVTPLWIDGELNRNLNFLRADKHRIKNSTQLTKMV